MRIPRRFAALVLAVPLLSGSCSDDEGRPMAPSASRRTASAPFAGVAGSSVVSSEAVAHPQCPGVPPFVAPFDLTVQAHGSSDVVLEQVRVGFVDFFGIPAPPVTLPQPMLITQFGSTLVGAGSSRRFPMQIPFGCGTARSGTLTIVVSTRDQRGSTDASQVVVTVR